MAFANSEQLFERVVPLANRTMLTVTQAPEHEQELLGLLDRAMTRGLRNRAQLTEIHLPLERYPSIDSKFWHIPIEDSGDAHVLRFFFETPQLAAQRIAVNENADDKKRPHRAQQAARSPQKRKAELHLIVDSTGLKLRGAGEWLFEKHGTTKRRAWRKLHIGIDAGNGEIVAFDLTDKDVDDASHVPTLLDQLTQARSCFLHGRWHLRQGRDI